MGDQPAGFASLLEHDMETRMELSPWLASVLVAAAYRGQGIGSALSERVVEEARNLGVSELYLFTFDREDFYARMGWVLREQTKYLGGQVSVMVRRLAA
jgi:N-acetylglutamate synthase-like GNAT family acetyltransferase